MNGWCERKVTPSHSKWPFSCFFVCVQCVPRTYHFLFARVPLTIRLPQSGHNHHLSIVLEVKLCLIVMSIGTGDDGSPRMHMRDPRVAAVKRERLLLILIPQTLLLAEELVF